MAPSSASSDDDNDKPVCYYEILGVTDRTVDEATIKKAYRKAALKCHPDKNVGSDQAAAQFRAVQQAYECLSDPVERKWYDDHRTAILAGWTGEGGSDGVDDAMVFDVEPYMYAGCYQGFDSTKEKSFYAVYQRVFEQILAKDFVDLHGSANDGLLPSDFGNASTAWEQVGAFYLAWQSFATGMSFSWVDLYDTHDAPSRRVRRAMEEENKKARRAAKRARNTEIAALVRFVQKRDPRVLAHREADAARRAEEQARHQQQLAERKAQALQAREEWKRQAEKEMQEAAELDRLAGRVRLADLEEDDYEYAGKKKKKGRKKKGRSATVVQQEEDDEEASAEETEKTGEAAAEAAAEAEEANGEASPDASPPIIASDEEDDEEESEESEEEPESWRCEACRKDFKSQGQMDNHLKSKKHKEMWKKHEAKVAALEASLLQEVLDEQEED